MDKQTAGTVVATTKQWWLKVNRKPMRMHALDGAEFPYIIKIEYTVDGKAYRKRKWISAGKPVPKMVNGYGYHLPDRIIKPAKKVQTPKAGVLFLWVCRDSRKAAQGVQPLVAAKPLYRSAGKSPCAEISPRQSAHARKGV